MLDLKSVVVACAFGVLSGASLSLADTDLFVLKRTDAGFVVERVRVTEGAEVSWTLGKDGFVDVILPPGPGGSAGIVQTASNPITVASCKGGKLSVSTTAMGKRFDRPAPTPGDLAALDIHVSARGADGKTFAGFIRNYNVFEADPVGVIEDPFGNAIPLQNGDCVLYTSTFPARSNAGATTSGACPIRYVGGHHLVPASIGTGKGEMVIDLAAGMTVVARSALPAGATIRPSEMVQHSADGVKRLASEMGGATGSVAPLGIATLPSLTIGDLKFENVDVVVMEALPPVAEGITGIVGLDLLGRANVISIPYPKNGAAGELRMSSATAEKPASTLSLAILDSRAHCKAKVNGTDVCLIVDTGSPITIVEERVSVAANLQPVAAEGKDVRGIGTARTQLAKANAETISLGEVTLKDQAVMVGSLPLFSRFKGPTPIGILGNETLAGFTRVEMDFAKRELRVYAE